MICTPVHQRAAPALQPATAAGRRMLVTVTVLGSAGPIRFVTSESETVAAVVGTTLRCYAREGRLPALGFDVGEFHLFCAHSDYMDPLDLSEPIGARGSRSFVLCKKTSLKTSLSTAPATGGRGRRSPRSQQRRGRPRGTKETAASFGRPGGSTSRRN